MSDDGYRPRMPGRVVLDLALLVLGGYGLRVLHGYGWCEREAMLLALCAWCLRARPAGHHHPHPRLAAQSGAASPACASPPAGLQPPMVAARPDHRLQPHALWHAPNRPPTHPPPEEPVFALASSR
jgi:hypothetical protein